MFHTWILVQVFKGNKVFSLA